MKAGLSQLFHKKIGLRALRLPVWLAGLGALGVVAVAGQALGPVLVGGAGGSAGVVASQNLFFTRAEGFVGHTGDIDQAAANIDTSGLIIQAAFRMHRGDADSALVANLENRGDNKRSATLIVEHPEGLGVNLETFDPEAEVAQLYVMQVSPGRVADCYLITLMGNADADLELAVLVGTADALGSHQITLTLQEVP